MTSRDEKREWAVGESDKWKSRSGTFYFDLFFEPLIDWGLKHLDLPGDSHNLLLDLGCGGGDKTDVFRRLGTHAIGIDISEEAIGYARRTYNETAFVLGDIHGLPFDAGCFDSVFCHSVLQYVDWVAVIKECHRVLKAGGKAVFIENLAGHPLARAYRLLHRCLGWRYMAHRTPRHHITVSELAGFSDVFPHANHRVFHLTTPVLLAIPALKHGLAGSPMKLNHRGAFRVLHRFDTWLLTRMPNLERYAWIAVIRATKENR